MATAKKVKQTHTKLRQVISIESVGFVEKSEIDMELRDEILGKDWSHEDKEWPEIIGDRIYYGYPISIPKLRGMIDKMKREGATHVSLQYHEDHIGYEMQGFCIRKAESKEVKKSDKIRKAIEEKQKIYDLLREQAAKIDEEIKQLLYDEGHE